MSVTISNSFLWFGSPFYIIVLSVRITRCNKLQTIVFLSHWPTVDSPVHHDFFDQTQGFSCVNLVKEQNSVYLVTLVLWCHRLCLENFPFNVFAGGTPMDLCRTNWWKQNMKLLKLNRVYHKALRRSHCWYSSVVVVVVVIIIIIIIICSWFF